MIFSYISFLMNELFTVIVLLMSKFHRRKEGLGRPNTRQSRIFDFRRMFLTFVDGFSNIFHCAALENTSVLEAALLIVETRYLNCPIVLYYKPPS